MRLLILLFFGLALGVKPDLARAQKSPLDTATAQALLKETQAALDSAPALRNDRWFMQRFAELLRAWRLPELPARLSVAEPLPELNALLASGDFERAIQWVHERPERDRIRYQHLLFHELVKAGRYERALAAGDSLRFPNLAASALFHFQGPGAPPRADRIALVRRLLQRTLFDERQRGQLGQTLLEYISETDLPAAWAEASATPDGSLRTWFHFVILLRASERELPEVDSLRAHLHGELLALPDTSLRRYRLGLLAEQCALRKTPICGRLNVAPARPEVVISGWRTDLYNALQQGRFEAAQEALDALSAALAPHQVSLIVLHALDGALPLCAVMNAGCGAGVDRWIQFWLPRAESAAQAAPAAAADSLNGLIAILQAARNPARAFATAERITDPTLQSQAFGKLAERIIPFDVPTAWRAVQRAGGRNISDHLLVHIARFQTSQGDSATARRTLDLLTDGGMRMQFEFEDAERLKQSGQWERARAVALAGLEYWDPSESHMAGSRGQFNLFVHLGLYEQLVSWARARKDPGDRATALAAVVGSITGWRSDQFH